MKIKRRPDPVDSGEATSGIWQQILDAFRAYGKEEIADQIIGAYQEGYTKRQIAKKLLSVIGEGDEQLYNMIIRVPEDYEFKETELGITPGLAIELFDMDSRWPNETMVGTHPVSGYRLIHLRFVTTAEKVVWLIELLKILYELPWTIMALQPYYGHPVYEDGEVTEDDPEPLPVLVGYVANEVIVPVKAQVLLSLNERLDADEIPLTAEYNWLSIYVDQADWVGAT